MIPYLMEEDEGEDRRMEIAWVLRKWAKERPDVNEDLSKCGVTYTRFTTDGMSIMLPDTAEASSGWGTKNHYFYEIVNRSGKGVFIQLSFSSRNERESG